MPGQWRSSAAQVFVGGRITKIEQYWASTSLTFDLFEMIDEWDLWDAAFGGMASKTKSDWATYRHGPGVAQGLLMKVGKLTGISKPRAVPLGTELFTSMEQNVTLKMQTLFDKSRLTINFNAGGWFGAQAGFGEYKTMWDRLTTDASLNVNPDPKNPAHVRAKADRWALYGQFGKADTDMAASGVVLPHVKKQGGTTSAPTWNYATTKPGPTDATKPMGVDSQVFAALNYGRRRHGANTTYGKSVFELDHGYKKDAIFFAMDTFTPVSTGSGYKSKSDRSKLYQVSANAFGGAILLAIKSQYRREAERDEPAALDRVGPGPSHGGASGGRQAGQRHESSFRRGPHLPEGGHDADLRVRIANLEIRDRDTRKRQDQHYGVSRANQASGFVH